MEPHRGGSVSSGHFKRLTGYIQFRIKRLPLTVEIQYYGLALTELGSAQAYSGTARDRPGSQHAYSESTFVRAGSEHAHSGTILGS